MGHEILGDRFRVNIGRADGGQSFVRVIDTVTGSDRMQVGFNGESADTIARRLASEILAVGRADLPITVSRVFSTDICRDGGSYSLCFYADDGEWYEFFVPINWGGDSTIEYKSPLLYHNSVNDGRVVRSFTWDEAAEFLAPLSYDNARFTELVNVVRRRGSFPIS